MRALIYELPFKISIIVMPECYGLNYSLIVIREDNFFEIKIIYI